MAQMQLDRAEPCHFPEFLGLENRMIVHEKCFLKIQQERAKSNRELRSLCFASVEYVSGWPVITVLPN